MTPEQLLTVLRDVTFLSELDAETLREVAARATVRRYAAGRPIVTELEYGAEVYVLAEGRAEVSVCPQTGKKKVLGEIGPGASFGEMASLTGELRSATVRSLTPIQVLVFSDRDFDELRLRRPEIAVSLVGILVKRLAETERTLSTLLSGQASASREPEDALPRSTLSLLWRELVVRHEKELPFLTLAAFVLALIIVRVAVYLAFTFDFAPREVLRAAYVSGFALVIVSACAALLTYRPKWRTGIALAFGVGAALVVNELGVTLAFDIFYKDIFTPDPTLTFDVERLYRRTEPLRATVIAVAFLIQAVYLKSFYARAWHLLQWRLVRWLRGR